MINVVTNATQLKLPGKKLLGDWIACIPGFTLDKYRQLQRSQLSIFSLECSGGIFSNFLALPFNSPIVNLKFSEEDYMLFLKAPKDYMKKILINRGMIYNRPLAALGDILVDFVHYKTFEEASALWDKRKSRINWDNLFVMMYTENKDILEQFDAFPYAKKVCFVPFKSDLPSAWYISPKTYREGMELGHMVRRFGWGEIFYYDLFDMLLYGKKTQLIDM